MNKLTWPTVGLIAILGGIAVALATLARWEPGAILGVLGILGGIGGGAAVGGAVAGRVDQVHAETAAQTPILEGVARSVNGDLDRRMAAHVKQGNADLVAELQRRGVIS